jgi:hypothetical protein
VTLGTGEAGRLLDQFALFLRARSIYPPGHGRVRAAAETLQRAIRERTAGLRPLAFRFRGREAEIDGETVPLLGETRGWLLRACRDLRLGGFEVEPEATVEDLLGFAERTVERLRTPGGAGSDAGHAPVRGLALRVVGGHGAPAPAGTIDERLAGDPEVAARLGTLQEFFDRDLDEPLPTDPLDVLPIVLDIALADAAMDEERAREVVCRVLEHMADQLSTQGLAGLERVDSEFARIAQEVAQRVFGRRGTLRQHDDAGLPTGRPEDARIDGDLVSLLDELDGLPSTGPARALEPDTAVDRAVAGILLHLCAEGSSEAARGQAAQRLARICAGDGGPRIAALLSAAPTDTVQRAAIALLETEVSPQLLRCEAVAPELFAERFPQGFAELLAEVPAGHPRVVRAIAAVLAQLASERVTAGIRSLATTVDIDRLAAAIAGCGPAAAATLGEIARDPRPELRPLLIRALRAMDLPAAESAALRCLPATAIDDEYLRALCTAATGEDGRRNALVQSGHLLRRFAEQHPRPDEMLGSRIEAVIALAHFPSLETRALLDELRRGWPISSRRPRELRAAARATLRRLGG